MNSFCSTDHSLPKKLHKALVGGKSDGYIVTEEQIEQAKDWYYAMSGWDISTGMPTREELEELQLDKVADELKL
jgi:aldehyde:ferredoxin oxidoreductase